MKIVISNEEGVAKVEVVGGDSTVYNEATVEEGHEVIVVATTAHSAEDLQVEPVQPISSGESETPAEASETGGDAEPGPGETAGDSSPGC